MNTYVAVYVGTMIISLLATGGLIVFGRRFGLLDHPGTRRVHERPVPRIGGLAILLGMLGPFIAVLFLDNQIGDAFRSGQTKILALVGGGVFICLVGLVDDVRGLRARKKLLAQVAAATAVAAFGVHFDDFFGIQLGWLSWPVTILWIVGITNAVNFIDGLDGLAAGIAGIACGVVAVLAHATGQPVMIVLMLALLGSVSGFLFLNFNPARIFMGDCGSMFLGFMIAGGSAFSSTKTATAAGLVMTALVLGVPLFDMFAVIVRRLLERRGIMSPDRGHLHHCLIAMGLTHRRAVLLLYGLTLFGAVLALAAMALQDSGRIAIIGGTVILFLVLFHLLGTFRLDDAAAKLKDNLKHAKETRVFRESFEVAELRLREAKSMNDWWQAICDAADHLDIVKVQLGGAGKSALPADLAWTRPGNGHQGAPPQTLRVTLPLAAAAPGGATEAKVEVLRNGSLELAGQRLTLFGRLLDDFGAAAAPAPSKAPSRAAAAPAARRPANGKHPSQHNSTDIAAGFTC